MFLRRTKKVIQKSHVQLENLDELNQPTVGDVELAIKVEGTGI